MATLEQIRSGLAANLRSGITDIQVSEYLLSNPTPPAAEMLPATVEYDQAMRGGVRRWTFTIRAFVGFSSDVGSQKRLDGFISPTGADSFKTAIESDPTLGGVVDDVHVVRAGQPALFLKEKGQSVLGVEFTVTVIA